eukprot:4495892-Amphidinium_carterae.1
MPSMHGSACQAPTKNKAEGCRAFWRLPVQCISNGTPLEASRWLCSTTSSLVLCRGKDLESRHSELQHPTTKMKAVVVSASDVLYPGTMALVFE